MQNILIVTDIFGDSRQLRETLQRIGVDAHIVSPYSELQTFANEADAYQAFTASGGMDGYYHRLLEAISQYPKHQLKLLVGFSAGASALWRFVASEHTLDLAADPLAWLYYGGQIRNELALEPKVSTVIRWSLETQFDVWQCHQALQNKLMVDSAVLPYPHGFVNPQSKGFIAHAAADFWMTLEAFAHTDSTVSVA